MNTISIRRFGLATGTAFALLNVGCIIVRATVGHEASLRFFNSLTHGVDWGPIMRHDIPMWEACAGIIEVFILGWLFAAVIAAVYNVTAGVPRSP